MERIYKPLDVLSDEDIKRILREEKTKELILLPLSLGEYHRDWKYAQDICIKLSNHENAEVRANAVLGLAYIARNHMILEKHLVKPIILKELRENTEYNWRIIDAIQDINIFLKWNLGAKTLSKYLNVE